MPSLTGARLVPFVAAAGLFTGCAGGGSKAPPVSPDAPVADAAAPDAATEHLHPVHLDAAEDGVADAGPAAPRDAHGDFARATGDPALLATAGDLHGAFLEVQCASEEIELQFCVPQDRGVIDLPLTFGGDPARRYAVVLKVWGVVEGVNYTGGKKLGDNFYAGGMAITPKTATYGLQVAAPAQTYYLNLFEIGDGDHYSYGITYVTPPITIQGASKLVLFAHSPDNIINTNHMQNEVMDPTPALQDRLAEIQGEVPQGQFVYIEVQSAKPMP
jgi:hypothetical protein